LTVNVLSSIHQLSLESTGQTAQHSPADCVKYRTWTDKSQQTYFRIYPQQK